MSDTLNFRSALRGFNREDVVHYIEYMNAQHASEISQLRAELESAQGGTVMAAPQADPELEQKLAQQAETIARLQAQLDASDCADVELHTQEEWDANIDARVQAEFDRDAANEARELAEAELAAAQEAKLQAEQARDAAIEALEQAKAQLAAALEAGNQETVQSCESAAPQGDLQQEELEAYRRAERTERLARERAEKLYRQADSALSGASVCVDEVFSQIGGLTGMVSQQLANLQIAVTQSKQALADATATLSQIRPEE